MHEECHLLGQTIPSPEYPGLQVHSKLPIVLSHTAFISQLSVSVSHSSMSKGGSRICDLVHTLQSKSSYTTLCYAHLHSMRWSCNCGCYTYIHTCAVYSISFVALVASAVEATICVCAVGIHITVVSIQVALINVYEK